MGSAGFAIRRSALGSRLGYSRTAAGYVKIQGDRPGFTGRSQMIPIDRLGFMGRSQMIPTDRLGFMGRSQMIPIDRLGFMG